MTERTIKIKKLIHDEVCMGTYGLVELELIEIEKEMEALRQLSVMQRSEQLNAFREFAKKNHQGLAILSLEQIMDEYLSEQLNKPAVISCVVVREDCPDDYWYSTQKGKKFNIKSCNYSDLREIEGFSNKEPNECWKVADGEFAGNVMVKQHCV